MKNSPIIIAGLAIVLSGCSPDSGKEAAAAPPAANPKHAGLDNVRNVAGSIWSGSEPHGREGFEELRRMGIKTIVSVDGTKPDLAAAEACGLRYLHLPHGYDGIPAATAAALAGLTEAQTGPLYVHCHHGRHRGPAAATIVAMGRHQLNPDTAAKFMESAGTGKNYAGLWRDVRNFPSLPPGTAAAPLVPSAPVDALVESMTQLDRAFDAITTNPKPDAAAALLVFEGFTESRRHLPANAPAELRQLMDAAIRDATRLRDTPAEASTIVPALKKQCTECHRRFRDE